MKPVGAVSHHAEVAPVLQVELDDPLGKVQVAGSGELEENPKRRPDAPRSASPSRRATRLPRPSAPITIRLRTVLLPSPSLTATRTESSSTRSTVAAELDQTAVPALSARSRSTWSNRHRSTSRPSAPTPGSRCGATARSPTARGARAPQSSVRCKSPPRPEAGLRGGAERWRAA